MLRLLPFALTAALFAAGITQGATFNYHGTLQDGGKAAEGKYDLELTLYALPSGGSVVAGPITVFGVPVSSGSFSTQIDFGPLSNIAGTAWLGVKVRPSGSGEFAALTARAPIAADATASVCPGAWTTSGNAGTSPGTGLGQNYLGTADNEPLVIAVNATQVGQITPSGNIGYPNSPNVVFGSSGNVVGAGIYATGATIGGGGSGALFCGPSFNQPCINSATSEFTTVSGGYNSTASGLYASVGGGFGNTASGHSATVSGGFFNQAGGDFSFAAGAEAKVRDPGPGPYGANNSGSCSAGNTCGDAGTFVWSDVEGAPFVSNGENQFLIRAAGGVGINTNSPFTPLHVRAGGSAGTLSMPAGTVETLESNANAFLGIETPTDKASGILFGNPTSSYAGGIYYNYYLDDGGLLFSTGNTISLYLSAAGHVAIGTSAPQTPLHVQVGGGAGVFTPYEGTLATLENDGDAFLSLVTPAANYSGIRFGNPANVSKGGIFYNFASYPDELLFNTNGATHMFLNKNGELGIGIDPGSGHAIDTSTGAYLSSTGIWTNNSSRALKEGFSTIDTGSILAKVLDLPITNWHYKQSDDSHIGPTAEDFRSAFGLGSDAQHIGTVDEEGVALAAIQGLNAKEQSDSVALRRENAELSRNQGSLRRENAELRNRLDDLTTRLAKLEAARGQ